MGVWIGVGLIPQRAGRMMVLGLLLAFRSSVSAQQQEQLCAEFAAIKCSNVNSADVTTESFWAISVSETLLETIL